MYSIQTFQASKQLNYNEYVDCVQGVQVMNLAFVDAEPGTGTLPHLPTQSIMRGKRRGRHFTIQLYV